VPGAGLLLLLARLHFPEALIHFCQASEKLVFFQSQ